MSLPARIVTVVAAFLVVVGGAVFVLAHYLLVNPPTVNFAAGHAAGQPVNMTIMTDPVNDVSSHPDWVSYFAMSPQTESVGAFDDLGAAGIYADQRDRV